MKRHKVGDHVRLNGENGILKKLWNHDGVRLADVRLPGGEITVGEDDLREEESD